MPTQTVKDTFNGYLKDISLTMIDQESSYTKQIKVIEEQFLRFGLTNEQLAQILAEINGKATQYITQYANASAMELIKLDENRPLLEAQIELARKELEIKEKDLEIKTKDLELKDKELEMKDKQIAIMTQELEIKKQELLIKQEQLKEMYAKIALINAQVTTEGIQQGLIANQSKLVARQEKGYDDNRRVKKSEHLSGLAGFAVNAGADNANTMVQNANQAANAI